MSASVRTYQESSTGIHFEGAWNQADHRGYLGGLVSYSTEANAKASMTFTGSGISWIGPVGPTRGQAQVWIDGRLVKTVSSYAASFSPTRVLYRVGWSSVKTHQITIVVLGTGGHPMVAIDALVVRMTNSTTSAATESVSKPKPATASKFAPASTAARTTTYDAVFGGDASGATDVTSALRTFLQSHNGQHVALAANGVYKVTQLWFTASNLTVDFRGARIQGSQADAQGIFRIRSSSNIVLNDPKVYGTGYVWADSTQWQHGIQVDGGSNITLNSPITRNTRGDGIFTGYDPGVNSPPTGVVINNPNVERAARNGIAPVGGQVTIKGGHIAYAGLHGIDIEPNDAIEAGSVRAVIDGVDIRHVSDLPVGYPGYAISAGWGYTGAQKPSLIIQNVTGDVTSIVVMTTNSVRILNNTSDSATFADITGSPSVSFSGNVRITRQ